MPFSIHYSTIESSIKHAKKTASELDDYVKEMNKVISDCSSVTGSDSRGYVSAATQMAREKVQRATKLKSSFTSLANQLTSLEDFAKETDKAVEHNIDVTVTNYVGKRSVLQTVGDWVYGMYVDFVNGIASFPVLGKYVAQGIRALGNWISNGAVTIHNYFKYGDGKYIWNNVTAVAGAIVAFVGVVTAAIAVVTAAPALVVVAIVGFVAASVYAVMKFGDMIASFEANSKALSLAKEYRESTKDKEEWWDTENDTGSITAARYYGNIGGVRDWIDKTDFGGKVANDVLGFTGKAYDFVETAAKTVSSVCQIATSLGNAQFMKDTDGKWIKDAAGNGIKRNGNFFQNIRMSYLEKVGYDNVEEIVLNKHGTFGENLRTLFSNKVYDLESETMMVDHIDLDHSAAFVSKFFEGYGGKLGKGGIKISAGELLFIDGAKLISNTDKMISNVGTVYGTLSGKESVSPKSVWETLKAGVDISSNWEMFDTYYGDASKFAGVLETGFKFVAKPFQTKEENAFRLYLNSRGA